MSKIKSLHGSEKLEEKQESYGSSKKFCVFNHFFIGIRYKTQYYLDTLFITNTLIVSIRNGGKDVNNNKLYGNILFNRRNY